VILGAVRAGVPRLLNLATSCMYPRAASNPLHEEQLLTGELEPTNEGYAIAKIASLKLCEYVNTEHPGLSYKSIIPCNIYGRYDHFDLDRGHLVAAVMAKLHEAKQRGTAVVDIWGDGTARREFMYAGDLANAIWMAVERFDALPQLMNVGLGADHSVNDYYHEIAAVVGFQGEFTHDLSKPTGMRQKMMEVGKMKAWGFDPSHSLRSGLELTYRYYRERVANG
jgi:GDP-L-fucose synthase